MTSIMSETGEVPVDLFTTDSGGTGQAVVLVHGWPLSGRSFKPQIGALIDAGYRVVTYDRRGFGQSSKPADGFDYDAMSDDLLAVIARLQLERPVVVGFSMGGGEIARYAGRFGTHDLAGMVFASAVPPFLLRTDDNPDGALTGGDLDQMRKGLDADPAAFYEAFSVDFYTAGDKLRVGDDVLENWRAMAAEADVDAALDCIDAFGRTDFRDDLTKIAVPTLVIHGAGDEIVPFEASGRRTAEAIEGAQLHVIEDGPHGCNASHPDEFNAALIDFLDGLPEHR